MVCTAGEMKKGDYYTHSNPVSVLLTLRASPRNPAPVSEIWLLSRLLGRWDGEGLAVDGCGESLC
jgi:hypothetical protein